MDQWHFLVLPSSDLLRHIYIFALCDLTPSLVCVNKATAETIWMPPNPWTLPHRSSRVRLLRLLYKLQGFTTSSADLTEVFFVLRLLTNIYNLISGTWLRQCIVEYQYLVRPFLAIPNRTSKGRYAWEVRREAALFFHYLDAAKVSRVSLNEIHEDATMELQRWHATYRHYTLTRAASEYRSRATCLEACGAHSFKCLQHDCALLAGDYRWLYKEPPRRPRRGRPRRFFNTVAEDNPDDLLRQNPYTY